MKIKATPTILISSCLATVSVLNAGAFERFAPEGTEPPAFSAAIEWSDKYIDNGENIVPESRFLFTEVTGEWNGFYGMFRSADALRTTFQEIHLETGYEWQWRQTAIVIAHNHRRFPGGGEDFRSTNEIILGAEAAVYGPLAVFGEFAYDYDEVRGGFFNVGLLAAFHLIDDLIAIEPYGLAGFDFGDISPSRRFRENHLQAGVVADLALTARASAIASINHSASLTNLDREGEGDHTWGTIGLALGF